MTQTMTGHPVVDAIGKINFEGHQVPHTWYEHLTYSNKRGTYCHHLAVLLLADIVYWYRPVLVKDEATGEIVGWRKKFKADKLQRSYKALAAQLKATDKQVREAAHFLQDLGLIDLDFRTFDNAEGLTLVNVLYIGCNPEKLNQITFSRKSSKVSPISERGATDFGEQSPISGGGVTEMGDTPCRNEEHLKPISVSNTKISTKISTNSLSPLTPLSAEEHPQTPPPTPRREREREERETSPPRTEMIASPPPCQGLPPVGLRQTLDMEPPATQSRNGHGGGMQENSQDGSNTPRLRHNRPKKSLHKPINPVPDPHGGGADVTKVYETEPGVINANFLDWREKHYIQQGDKWANAPRANAVAEIRRDESRALALWQDYQRSMGTRCSPEQEQEPQFLPSRMTDRQHKDWATEYQADPEKFMAKPEATAWLAYIDAMPLFKSMIFGELENAARATHKQSARIQRQEANPSTNRGGRSSLRRDLAGPTGSDGPSDRHPSEDERILRERAQHYLQWLSEAP